jgi:hypothetical protein
MKVGDLVRCREYNKIGIIIRFDSFGLMWHILCTDGDYLCSNGGFLEVICK